MPEEATISVDLEILPATVDTIEEISRQTGKSPNDVVRAAIDNYEKLVKNGDKE